MKPRSSVRDWQTYWPNRNSLFKRNGSGRKDASCGTRQRISWSTNSAGFPLLRFTYGTDSMISKGLIGPDRCYKLTTLYLRTYQARPLGENPVFPPTLVFGGVRASAQHPPFWQAELAHYLPGREYDYEVRWAVASNDRVPRRRPRIVRRHRVTFGRDSSQIYLRSSKTNLDPTLRHLI